MESMKIISTEYFSFVSLFGEKLRSLALHKHQFEPYEIYNHDSLDNFIRGMASQPTQDMDSSFSRQVHIITHQTDITCNEWDLTSAI